MLRKCIFRRFHACSFVLGRHGKKVGARGDRISRKSWPKSNFRVPLSRGASIEFLAGVRECQSGLEVLNWVQEGLEKGVLGVESLSVAVARLSNVDWDDLRVWENELVGILLEELRRGLEEMDGESSVVLLVPLTVAVGRLKRRCGGRGVRGLKGLSLVLLEKMRGEFVNLSGRELVRVGDAFGVLGLRRCKELRVELSRSLPVLVSQLDREDCVLGLRALAAHGGSEEAGKAVGDRVREFLGEMDMDEIAGVTEAIVKMRAASSMTMEALKTEIFRRVRDLKEKDVSAIGVAVTSLAVVGGVDGGLREALGERVGDFLVGNDRLEMLTAARIMWALSRQPHKTNQALYPLLEAAMLRDEFRSDIFAASASCVALAQSSYPCLPATEHIASTHILPSTSIPPKAAISWALAAQTSAEWATFPSKPTSPNTLLYDLTHSILCSLPRHPPSEAVLRQLWTAWLVGFASCYSSTARPWIGEADNIHTSRSSLATSSQPLCVSPPDKYPRLSSLFTSRNSITLPPTTITQAFQATSAVSTHPSQSQRSIVAALQDLGWNVQQEAPLPNIGVRVDALLFPKSSNIPIAVLEVDGPSHAHPTDPTQASFSTLVRRRIVASTGLPLFHVYPHNPRELDQIHTVATSITKSIKHHT